MRSEKTHLVNYIGGLLKDSDYVYFVSYKGLDVKQFSDFRSQLADKEAQCHVLKNRLIKKAAELFEIEDLASFELKDTTALISGSGDPGAVAKVIKDFGKEHEAVAAKGGYFEGAVLSEQDVCEIAALPAKEVLQAQLLGVLQAPARDFVSVLNAKAATILNVLNAYKDKIENN
ncbi:50S ribosomal protein L10 [Lentisphaerota bacterium ZTH]|nr:50S ribosomal protein L10 [Lentisphaerota bacterium]WET06788.1 50S ribosomal protein L10 [Lentisphaerota bacterium ZTH]